MASIARAFRCGMKPLTPICPVSFRPERNFSRLRRRGVIQGSAQQHASRNCFQGRDARDHGLARRRQFRTARRCPRPAGVGWRGSGAQLGARRVRHRPRDRLGRLWLGSARSNSAWCSATSRSAKSRRRPATRRCARRPRGRHRAPARSGAVPVLCRRRMGHVPQRPLHRTRHQGPARLWRRPLPHRARIRGQDRSRIWALSACCSSPTSIVAKAWDHTEGIGRRSRAWKPRTLLVTGAGSIGLLAALMGVQRGLEVHVLDHNENGPKRRWRKASAANFTSARSPTSTVSSPTS